MTRSKGSDGIGTSAVLSISLSGTGARRTEGSLPDMNPRGSGVGGDGTRSGRDLEIGARVDADALGHLADRPQPDGHDLLHALLLGDVQEALAHHPVEDEGLDPALGADERVHHVLGRDLAEDVVLLSEETGPGGVLQGAQVFEELAEARRDGRRGRPGSRGLRDRPDRRHRGPAAGRAGGLRAVATGGRSALGAHPASVPVPGGAALLDRSARRSRGLEPGHLQVLLELDLVAQALHDLLLGEILHLRPPGGPGDEVEVHGLEHLAQDELPTPVPIGEGRDGLPPGELAHRLRDRGPLHGDDVLDAAAQEVQHVRAALHHDDGIGGVHVGTGGQALPAVGDDLLDLHGFADLLGEVGPHVLGLALQAGEQVLGPLDDARPLRGAHVLERGDLDPRLARPDPVHGLEAARQDGRLHLVQGGGDEHLSFALAFLRVDLDLDPADPAALLQVPQVELVAQKALGLAEDGPHHVGLLDDAVGGDPGSDQVLRRIRVHVHVLGASLLVFRPALRGPG